MEHINSVLFKLIIECKNEYRWRGSCAFEQIYLFHEVLDPFGTKRNTNSAHRLTTKQFRKIVIPAPTTNAAHIYTNRFYLDDRACIIGKTTCQGGVKIPFLCAFFVL